MKQRISADTAHPLVEDRDNYNDGMQRVETAHV
jgi:hypothetical protein